MFCAGNAQQTHCGENLFVNLESQEMLLTWREGPAAKRETIGGWRKKNVEGELLKNDCFGLEGSGLGSGWLLQVNRWPSAARRSTCHCCQVGYCTCSSDSLLCALSPATAAGIFALGLQRSLWHSHLGSHKIAESLHEVVWNYGVQSIFCYENQLISTQFYNGVCVCGCQDFQDSVT